jgi:hypothetical protein
MHTLPEFAPSDCPARPVNPAAGGLQGNRVKEESGSFFEKKAAPARQEPKNV